MNGKYIEGEVTPQINKEPSSRRFGETYLRVVGTSSDGVNRALDASTTGTIFNSS